MATQKTEKRPHAIIAWTAIGTVLIGAGGLVVAVANHRSSHPTDLEQRFPIGVIADGNPVAGAEVGLSLVEVNPSYTDSKGQVFFPIPGSLLGKEAHIFIRKAGFQVYDQQVVLNPRSDFYVIRLERDKPPFSKAASTPERSGSADASGDNSIAINGSNNAATVNGGNAGSNRGKTRKPR